MSNHKEWMQDLNGKIGDRALKDIVIPGSHDAGTWDLTAKIGDNFAKCQRVDIKSQLLCGSRYLDLRAQYRDGDWFMYHGSVTMNTKLSEVIEDIKWFLDKYPQEVVIVTLLGPSATQCQTLMHSLIKHAVTPDDERTLNKNFSHFTPNELSNINKNFIPLNWVGDLIDLKNGTVGENRMNRGGIYYDLVVWTPKDGVNYFDAHYSGIDTNKMWIYHLNVPFTTTVLSYRPWWVATVLAPPAWIFAAPAFVAFGAYKAIDLLTGMEARSKDIKKCYSDSLSKINKEKPLNIINIDFVDEFDWVEFVVGLN